MWLNVRRCVKPRTRSAALLAALLRPKDRFAFSQTLRSARASLAPIFASVTAFLFAVRDPRPGVRDARSHPGVSRIHSTFFTPILYHPQPPLSYSTSSATMWCKSRLAA